MSRPFKHESLKPYEVFAFKQINGQRACMKVLDVEARTPNEASKTGQSFSRYVTSVEDEISDEHTELIFEACMECKDLSRIEDEKLRAACSSAIESLPFSKEGVQA